jgi:hypothetical protein
MILDPATYRCPSHSTNLTEQVREQLTDEDGWPIAFKARKAHHNQPEFEVVVYCPGNGTPHPLTCHGTLKP